MAKTKGLTWQEIFQNPEIYQLATELGIPIDRLLEIDNKDKIFPIKGLRELLSKATYHKDITKMIFNNYRSILPDEPNELERMNHTQAIMLGLTQ